MQTDSIYGNLPRGLGLIDLSPAEMMFWLYCPIKVPGTNSLVVPDNLVHFDPILDAVCAEQDWFDRFIYITAKTLWVTPSYPGNRPGWHSDGFLTDDLNYIWYDSSPTVFFFDGEGYAFTADHADSLLEMDSLCEPRKSSHITYPVKHLLKLDQTVLHKVGTVFEPGVRTFVKISVSRHRYALKGNSVNHRLASDWEYDSRVVGRNCPIGATANVTS